MYVLEYEECVLKQSYEQRTNYASDLRWVK